MEQGMIIVFTGDGKGKSTAALGQCMRVVGWNKECCIVQFLKSPDFQTGENLFCNHVKLEMYTLGIGFSWEHTKEEQLVALEEAWKMALEKMQDTRYSLVVLDEILGVLSLEMIAGHKMISEENLIFALENRPEHMDVILTGRGASEKIITFADLVTEMKCLKHPYAKGIAAKKGLEY